ncbi:hypothetical protein HDU83_008999, partial [Entophlyctis luteolus]
FAVQIKVACFEFEPKPKDVTSRPHTCVEVFYILMRALLAIGEVLFTLYGFYWKSSNNFTLQGWLSVVLCLAVSGSLSLAFIWYIPYFNFRYAQLRAGMMLCFFWVSLCQLYVNIRPYAQIQYIMIILMPFSFGLAFSLVALRRQWIEATPAAAITDPYTLELKARFLLMQHGLLFGTDVGELGAYPCSARSPGDLAYGSGGAGGDDKLKAGLSALEEARRARNNEVLTEINDMFVHAAKVYPNNCMNRAQCLALTTKAAGMRPRWDEMFMLFKRQRDLHERLIGSDGVDFIAYERHLKCSSRALSTSAGLQNAKMNEKKASMAIVQFWGELMKRRPNIHKIENYGEAITQAITDGQASYLALLKLSPQSPNVYRLYGSFMIGVMNDARRGQELIDHAEDLEESAQRGGGDGGGEDDDGAQHPLATSHMDMFSDRNGLVTISGEKNNMCEVIHVNQTCLDMFGFKKQDLVGQNITKIIPHPFARPHDMLVSKYLETGFAKVIDRPRPILGVNSSGALIQFILCVKHIVDPEGKQSFVGIMKPGRSRADLGYMIVDDALRVLHASENVCALFGFKPRACSSFKLDSVWPKIAHDAVKDKAGIKSTWTKGEVAYDMHLFGDEVSVGGTACFICRVKFSAASPSGGTAQSRSEMGSNPMVFSPSGSKTDIVQNRVSVTSDEVAQKVYGRRMSINTGAGGCPFAPSTKPPQPTEAQKRES